MIIQRSILKVNASSNKKMALHKTQILFIYNSISKKKEKFSPINKGAVGMYVCGPTVYSNVHMGNCRTFLSFDLVFRYLKHLDYKVRYVRNITDAGHLENDGESGEDPIAKKAKLENIEPMEVVQKYTVDFHQTMAKFDNLHRSSCLPMVNQFYFSLHTILRPSH